MADSNGISAPDCTARLMRPTALAALFGGQNCLAYSCTWPMKSSPSRIESTMPSPAPPRRRTAVAGDHELDRPALADDAHQALGAAGARQDAQRDLGQADLAAALRWRCAGPRPWRSRGRRRRCCRSAPRSPASASARGATGVSLACRQKKYLKYGSDALSMLMLAPAQNIFSPAPVSTITCTSLSKRALRMPSSSSRIISWV